MKLAIVSGRRSMCCLCEWNVSGAEEWELLEHLRKKHDRMLVTVEEKKNSKVYHGNRPCPFLDTR